MKFPFDFIKLIFRLIFPGVILGSVMVPATHAALNAAGLPIELKYAYPFEVIAWGWLIVISDMHIYMLFSRGRRYWPPPLSKLFKRFQEIRLNRLRKIIFDRRTIPTQ